MRSSGPVGVIRGLVLCCHPLPCLAVTAFTTAYAALAGRTTDTPGSRLAAIAAAALAGQFCVGWTNDLIDAGRDRRAGRPDKPLAVGSIGRGTVLLALVIAAVLAVTLSLRLGVLPGVLHLVAVGSALAYNAGLKRTVISPLPYLLSFSLLPVVASLAAAGPGSGAAGHWPPAAHVVAAGLLGVAAHAANTVGDAAADAATGVRGLPQRLGPGRSLAVMAALVALAALVLLTTTSTDGVGRGPAGYRLVTADTLLVAGAVLAGLGALRRVGLTGGRSAFRLALAAVALVLAGFLTAA